MIVTHINNVGKRKYQKHQSAQVSWNFKKAKWNEYREALEVKLNKEEIFGDGKSVDRANKLICSLILETAKKTIPISRAKKYKPFWNENLRDLKEKRDRFRRKAELTHKEMDVNMWRKLARDLKLEIIKSKRRTFDKFITNIDYKRDSKKVYRFLSTLTNKYEQKKKQPFIIGNKQVTEDAEIANAFVKYYAEQQRKSSEMKKQEVLRRRNDKNVWTSPEHEICNTPFGVNELKHAICKQRMRKSPGTDGIHAEFIKHLGPKALNALLCHFNLIWNSYVPAAWKKSILIPIIKANKSPEVFSSYRPISLNSIVAKVMERMVNERIVFYLEGHNRLSTAQAGFRRLQSTNQQVTMLSQAIKDALDKKKTLVAVFIDFKSAYDRIWRSQLYFKLQQLGIGGRMLNWIRGLTSQRYCSVRYGNSMSGFRQTHRGLPQGGVSSSILFNIYINDLPGMIEKIPGIRCALYADDLVLWASDTKRNSKNLTDTINKAMRALFVWCEENKMEVNREKTVYQTFTLNRQPTSMGIMFDGVNISETSDSKYLGVTFDKRLTWKNHVEVTANKAQKRLCILKRLAGVQWGCNRETLNITYNMYIKPLLTYCCEPLITCSAIHISKLERVQNQALRLITGAVKTTNIRAMQILTRNRPLSEIFQERAVCLFEKMIRLPNISFWRDYGEGDSRKLVTQDGFIQRVLKTRDKLSLPDLPETIPLPASPMDRGIIPCMLQLMQPVIKSDTSSEVLLSLALETIYTRFPSENWLHVYTDGSRLSVGGNVGVGIHSNLFSMYSSLGPNATHYDGELEAIKISGELLLVRLDRFKKVVILSDCASAIQAICSSGDAESCRMESCRSRLEALISSDKEVMLQWIPSHCGIEGNELADYLAKKGTEILQSCQRYISFKSAQRLIKNEFGKSNELREVEDIRTKKEWKGLTGIPAAPRYRAVAAFRLMTGHDCLASHLYRIGIFGSPNCVLCHRDIPMDADHLASCEAVSGEDICNRYWNARDQMQRICS